MALPRRLPSRRRARILLLTLLACVHPACAPSRPKDDGQAPLSEPPAVTEPTLHTLRVGDVPVRVRLALRDAERRRGLAGVARLEPWEGMLFVYARADRRTFWMKDCLIALDVAYLDAEGRVFQIETLQPPAPDGAIPQTGKSVQPTSMVLEMPGGFFALHGLGLGTTVTIPRSVPLQAAE